MLCKYMQHKLEQTIPAISEHEELKSHVGYFSEIVRLLAFANAFMHLCYNCGLWLTKKQRDGLICNLQGFLDTFASLAQRSFDCGMCRWKIQPKYHMCGEMLFTLLHDKAQGAQSMNPVAYATQVDEDFVGRVSTFSRTVSSRTLPTRTLQKYLLALKASW